MARRRSLAAIARRYEREARRIQRELERQRKQLAKMRELERATYEVQVYENHLDLLQSVHKECGDTLDWDAIQSPEPPIKPSKLHTHEKSARDKLDVSISGVSDKLDKLFDRAKSKSTKAVEDVQRAILIDEQEYQKAIQAYEQELAIYEQEVELYEIATSVLAGDPRAYLDAIGLAKPFDDIGELGSSIEFEVGSNSLIVATVYVNSDKVIPPETKTVLKSGQLSVKKMPKTRFYELYQDYVCGCVLRVARELFALLPIETVIVNAMGTLLNTQTGYMEEQPILSVAIPRRTLEGLNFEMLDPSDSMGNFVHRMGFRKAEGFNAVEALEPSDLRET